MVGVLGLVGGRREVSQGLVGGFLDGICDTVGRIHIPLMPSNSPIICCSPIFILPLIMQFMNQYTGKGEQNGPPWQHPTQPGKVVVPDIVSLLQRKKSQAEKVLLGTELCCLGAG